MKRDSMPAEIHAAGEPRRIGPYRVTAHIWRSHLCDVYRCRDVALERDVVIKVPRTDGAGGRAAASRLRREALVRAAVEHASVLPLFHAWRSRWGISLVGPWLPGGTLLERQDALGPGELAAVVRAVGDALDALHAAGWLHGDLNGRNVLFGGDGRAILIDFGSVRRIGSRWSPESGETELGVTPQTVAPEVWRGDPADGRSDLYGLGALLYRTVTGRYPFESDDWSSLPEQHCNSPVPLPSSLSPAFGPEVEAVLLRALAKDPTARFRTGEEMAVALGRALEAPAAGPRPAPGFSEKVRAAGAHLERFAATLDERERVALQALLDGLREVEARATAEVASLTTELFAVPASLLALEETGAAEALGEGAGTAAEVAAACGAPEPTVSRLLEVLATAGLVGESEGRYSLPPPLGVLYGNATRLGTHLRPVREAAELWSRLPHWARTREPYVLMDRPDGGGYSPVVDLLASLFVEPARRLAGHLLDSGALRPGAAILDVGAGSAVWSLAAALGDPEATVTALDRPAVLEVARTRAAAAGLEGRFTPLAGDWREVPLPEAAFDLVLVANLCHLEPGAEVVALLRRLRPTLRSGGFLVVVDTIPEARRGAPLSVLLAGLRLSLRTPRGDIHDLESYRRWLEEAGLDTQELVHLLPDQQLSALIARTA